MKAASHKPKRDGRDVDHLVARATMVNHTVNADANLDDTIDLMKAGVPKYAYQVKDLAEYLSGKDDLETCRNVFVFCREHFRYKEDDAFTEQVRQPARCWADRDLGVDCDCFSMFIGCILWNLQIPFYFKITMYPRQDAYSHIYVVARLGQTHVPIDPVIAHFNYEVTPIKKSIEIPMLLENLGNPYMKNRRNQRHHRNAVGATTVNTSGVIPGTAKGDRIIAEAAAKGMTIEQYQEWTRQEFIRQNGMTPEQFASQVQNTITTQSQAGQAALATEIAKMKKELDARKVKYPANATRDQLYALLKSNPAPSTGANIANTINKVNPATVLLRNGILASLKLNLMNVAENLRWGYLTPAQAQAQNFNMARHTKLVEALRKLEKIHFAAGGEIFHMKDAILKGKGNADKKVALAGGTLHRTGDELLLLGSDSDLYDILGPELYTANMSHLGCPPTMNGLGVEPVTAATAIAAATAAMGAVAAVIKNIGDLKQAGAPGANTALPDLAPTQEEIAAGEEMAMTANEVARATEETPPPPPPKKSLMQKAKDNPGLVVAAALGLGLTTWGVYELVKADKKKKKAALNGAKRRKSAAKRKKSAKAKKAAYTVTI